MRLGEIRNKLDEVVDSENRIQLETAPAYNGQAQRISNFGAVVRLLDILSKQDWNSLDYTPISNLKKRFNVLPEVAILENGDFNQFQSYLNSLNSSVPLYYEIINSFVEDQDEKTLNIKLPSDIDSLRDLDALNKRLDEIFKLLNVDGEFEFKSFDKGTDWYVLVAKGVLTYQFAISCLKVAQEYLKTKVDFFKSEEARIGYEVALKNKGNEDSQAEFEAYIDSYMDIKLEKRIRGIMAEIPHSNGKQPEELHAHLVKATTKLVKELGEGTEFHLSLNPPKYAVEKAGSLQIDYKKIQALAPKKIAETKALETPKTNREGNKSEDEKTEK